MRFDWEITNNKGITTKGTAVDSDVMLQRLKEWFQSNDNRSIRLTKKK